MRRTNRHIIGRASTRWLTQRVAWRLATPQRTAALWAVLAGASVALGGCAGVWERHFVGAPLGPEVTPVAPALLELREVPWERVEATLTALNADVVASDLHPDEWPQERQGAARAQLLRGIQVSEEPTRVRIIGTARFRTTDSISPTDGKLADHASRVGASRVVFSRADMGVADRIVSAPVTVFGGASAPYDRHGASRWTSWDGGTAWVPVVVQARETAWTVFWLRVD